MNIQVAAPKQTEKVSVVDTGTRHGRVLIHGINYPPEPIGVGRYTGEFAEYLVQNGYQVEVVTATPHYPGWQVRAPYSNKFSRETRNGVSVIRCPLLLHSGGRGLWRLLMPLTFAFMAAPVAMWRIFRFRPDVVVCVEPTLFSSPAAILAAKLVGARRVLHVHDLEVEAAFAVGHLKSAPLKRLFAFVERVLVRRFDVIVTLSDQMRDRLLAKGPKTIARLTVIRNWVDTARIAYVSGPNAFHRELGFGEEDFVVLYAGQIGPKQCLHLVFEAAEKLRHHQHIKFVVAGDGPMKQEFVDRYGSLPNVQFLPLQPEDRLCELLNLANLHILPQSKNSSDFALPSKLGAMLATRRPILVTADEGSELHRLLQDAATIVPTDDSAAMAQGILAAQSGRHDPVRLGALAIQFSRDVNLPALMNAICC